jgi:hypothetical protein
MWTSWNARAMPRWASLTGPMPAMSSPLKRTTPSLGFRRPVRTLTSVVLPAPFGPTIATVSPAATDSVMPSRATKSP